MKKLEANTSREDGGSAVDLKLEANTSREDGGSAVDLNFWRKILQDHYATVCLPCTPLINDGKSQLISDNYLTQNIKCELKPISIDNIFDTDEENRSKRILIEGEPGFGKTTLALKLIHDWALSKDYMKQFELAFFIPLRQLKNMELTKAIQNIVQNLNREGEFNAEEVMKTNSSNILLIFDGLDEWSTEDKLPILNVLYQKTYMDMTIIVTSKPGTSKKIQQENFMHFDELEFWDKHVALSGPIEEIYYGQLLPNIFPEPQLNRFLEMIKEIHCEEMLSSPMFLIMFSCLKKRDLAYSTKTEFFKDLFNCVMKNYLQKKEETVDDHFDLFTVEDTLTNLQVVLRDFGDLAMVNLVDNKLLFESNCINTIMMYNMGFLLKHNNIFLFKTEPVFEACHLYIVEFSAAFSAFAKFKLVKEESEKRKLLRHYVDLCFLKGKPSLFNTSLFFPFLVGLLQDEAWLLFSEFKSYSFWFQDFFFCLLLSEHKSENVDYGKLLAAIEPIIPVNIFQTDTTYRKLYDSELYQKVITCGIEMKKIAGIHVNNSHYHKLPVNVYFPKIYYTVYPQKEWKEHDWMKEKCQKFVLNFDSMYEDSPSHEYFNLLTSIKADERSLVLNGPASYKTLEEWMKQEPKQVIEIEKSWYDFTCQEEIACIQHFLSLFPVKRVVIDHLSGELDINQLVKPIAESEHLTIAAFKSKKNCEIDLAELTKGGTKTFFLVMFKLCKMKLEGTLENPRCISNLVFENDVPELKNASIVCQLEPTVFICYDHLLVDLKKTSPQWIGYESVDALGLIIRDGSNAELWDSLTSFKKVTELKLALVKPQSDTDFEKIAKCIRCLSVKDLILDAQPNEDHLFYLRLVRPLVDLMDLDGQCMDSVTLKLVGDELGIFVRSFCTTLSILVDAVSRNVINYVTVESFNFHLWSVVIEKKVIDESRFEVQHLCPPVHRKTHTNYGCQENEITRQTVIKRKE